MKRVLQIRLEVQEDEEGWRLFAVPENRAGWAPIALTKTARGTAGGALVEFAAAMYALQTEDDPVCGVEGEPPLGDGPLLQKCELPAGHKGSHQSGSIRWIGYFPGGVRP